MKNILLFLPIFPSHVVTANKPSAASNWLAAPNNAQTLAYPLSPRATPKATVIRVATKGLVKVFLKPVASSLDYPGSSQNSWNI